MTPLICLQASEKVQMSEHVKTYPGPQNHLRPQRVKDPTFCK